MKFASVSGWIAGSVLAALVLSSCATVARESWGTASLSARDRDARVQIFLDEEGFGPGKIDGAIGEFGWKALECYARVHGLGILDPRSKAFEKVVPVTSISPIYTTYTIRPEDAKWIGSLPDNLEDRAKLPLLPYTSYLEFVAERYHADRTFLAKLNPGLDLHALKPGDTVQVPNVTPFQIETLRPGGYLIPPKSAMKGNVVKIDTTERMLKVYGSGNRLLAAFPITPGSKTLPAPKGTWKVVNMASMPFFRYDEKMLNEGVRSDNFINLPPGPNGPVGVMWMGLSKSGVGMHGTNNPDTIGRAASHGCIRLSNWDAVKLSGMVTQGIAVAID
jgi:lipoprotein-anchoring transpeptidase ErfK/SrfK